MTTTTVEDGPNAFYASAPLKVLHLLKQPTQNDPPSIPELIGRICSGGKPDSPFMRRVAERSYALLKPCSTYSEVRRATDAELCRALESVAIVNLCNNVLARNTPAKMLLYWANNNRSRWHDQIVRCKPRLIVCGGTFDAVWKALKKPHRSRTSTGMFYFSDPIVTNCTYIWMPHPGAHYDLPMVITFLVVSLKEILP